MNTHIKYFLLASCLINGYPLLANTITGSNASSSSTQALQQSTRISGKIVDKNGEAIIGANVIEKGTSNGTITNIDGRFELTVQKKTIVVSYIGYMTKEVTVNSRNMTITLEEDSKALEEVVIVGFGTQKKVNLTGSVSSVDQEKLAGVPATNVTSMLQGKLPGVAITQTSGLPGRENTSICIRGVGTMNNAAPMVLVDGLEASMDDVNPNDIESVSVLKDAAAASIYGTRAANGVILVTTKRGKSGKPTLTYNGYVGFQQAIHLPEHLSSAEYAELYNEGLKNEGASPAYSAEDIEKYRNGSDPYNYPNTDWMDALLQGSGFTHNHNLSINGGTEATRYAVSLGYYNQEGLTKNTDYDRYNREMEAHLAKALVEVGKQADEWAAEFAAKKYVYVQEHPDMPHYFVGCGNQWGATYSYGMCYWEEQLWIRTRSVSCPEFFHGMFEIVDAQTPVTLFMGEDEQRPLAERVKNFLPKVCRNFTVIDTKDYALDGISPEFRGSVSHLVMRAVNARVDVHMEKEFCHPLDIRRYYRQFDY